MRRAVALVCLLALGLPAGVHAFHQRTPAFLQVTPATPGTVGNPRWAGFRYVLFDSDADLLGNASSGRQICSRRPKARSCSKPARASLPA